MSAVRLYCSDIRKAAEIPPDCCDSCHEDADLGYCDLMDYAPLGTDWRAPAVVAFVCCRVANAVGDMEDPQLYERALAIMERASSDAPKEALPGETK